MIGGILAAAGVVGWFFGYSREYSVAPTDSQTENNKNASRLASVPADAATQQSNAIRAVLDPMSVVPEKIRARFSLVLGQSDAIRRAALLDDLLKHLLQSELVLLFNALPKGSGP